MCGQERWCELVGREAVGSVSSLKSWQVFQRDGCGPFLSSKLGLFKAEGKGARGWVALQPLPPGLSHGKMKMEIAVFPITGFQMNQPVLPIIKSVTYTILMREMSTNSPKR